MGARVYGSRRRDRIRVAFAATLIAATASLGGAAAQGNDSATAEALFLEGRQLMGQKQWSAAADKLRASDRAEPSVGARISLGDCLVELGKTASAWAAYREASNLAQERSDRRRAKIASDRAAALLPKLTYVVLKVPQASRVEGLEITWDGDVRPTALWGQRFPVDPGSHSVGARAKGHKAWSDHVSAGGPGAEVAVEVPPLEAIPEASDPTNPPRPGHDLAGQVEAGPVSPFTPGRKAAIGIAAAGVVGLAAGTVFGLSARSKWNDAQDNHCDNNLCDQQGVDLTADARSAGNISTVAFAIGTAAIGGAVVLWFVSAPESSTSPTAEHATLAPALGPDLTGLSLSGHF